MASVRAALVPLHVYRGERAVRRDPALESFQLPPVPSILAGLCLLCVIAYEVYATILHSRARSGPIAEALNRGTWRLARLVAFRLSAPRRHRMLNAVGPLLLPALVGVLVVLMMIGYALLYWPYMPDAFNVDEQAASPPWIEALYFSGITLTTLGYGDITPRATGLRLLALSEAAAGFVSISLAVTYLTAVTGALERKRAVALSFYHQAEQGADTTGFLLHHCVRGRFIGLDTVLAQAARDLQGVLESHVEHPVIHYFHPVEVHKSLPRMLFISLDLCATIRCCLDEDAYPDLCLHPELHTLDETARHVLREMVRSLQLRDAMPNAAVPTNALPSNDTPRWRTRFQQTLARLRTADLHTRPDTRRGFAEYCDSRREWEKRLGTLSVFLGYSWEEVTGDLGLQHAVDAVAEDVDA